MNNKPFNLEQALAGKPVKLRKGWKAYVKYIMPEEYEGSYPLRGICFKTNKDIVGSSWDTEGKYSTSAIYSDLDIVGMWEESRPKVTLTLPCPLKEPQEEMWSIVSGIVQKSNYTKIKHSEWYEVNKRCFNAGFYFATKQDAEEWLNAMKRSRR